MSKPGAASARSAQPSISSGERSRAIEFPVQGQTLSATKRESPLSASSAGTVTRPATKAAGCASPQADVPARRRMISTQPSGVALWLSRSPAAPPASRLQAALTKGRKGSGGSVSR
jgi:hypothetical protein